VSAQGGNPDVEALPGAPIVRPLPAAVSGFVQAIGATAVGEAALRLGAGRIRKEDDIDHGVGIVCLAKRGDPVYEGEPLAEIYARTEEDAERAVGELGTAYRLGSDPPEERPIVLDIVA
jgi:thymidine phosphorylase